MLNFRRQLSIAEILNKNKVQEKSVYLQRKLSISNQDMYQCIHRTADLKALCTS